MEANPDIEAMLLEALANIPEPDERAAFLAWACRNDEPLKIRMERLIASNSEARGFLDFHPFEIGTEAREENIVTEAGEIGLHIGRYRLLRRLGQGGCGVVYLAEQESPLRRLVAIKLIRVGLAHQDVLARFDAERQALAIMDHPGIAKVHDASSTVTGQPFFVMEWVDGEKITDFCAHHQLPVARRLALFIQVCQAIQHAHQKGIIHRDLKPSNVLVALQDGVPMAKIIDFGIAKATGQSGNTGTGTQQNQGDGTPDYMSPEQAEGTGLDVDTRSDIFSLGVLLCELLAGTTPQHAGAGTGMSGNETDGGTGMSRMVAPSGLFAALPGPDARAVASQRASSLPALAKLLTGDLDAIVVKCLQTERQHRYATANDLAADIQHYLRQEPVQAREAGRAYRLAKLVRRNKLAFALGILAVISLALGFGTSTWLFVREASARRDAESARVGEILLRERAEAREACAMAAVLLSYGRSGDADKLVAGIRPDLVPASLEAAEIYEKLGDRHRRANRWEQAADRYLALVESHTRADPSDRAKISSGTLYALGAICQLRDWQRYEHIRRISLARFGATKDANVAEQILKLCLVRPADAAAMQALLPLSAVVENSLSGASPATGATGDLQAWASLSLSLWYYRSGDFPAASGWARRAAAYDDRNAARMAIGTTIQAMADCRSGRPAEARLLFATATQYLTSENPPVPGQSRQNPPKWWDLAIAGAFMEEATGLLRGDIP